jgi:hypothetical protein
LYRADPKFLRKGLGINMALPEVVGMKKEERNMKQSMRYEVDQ